MSDLNLLESVAGNIEGNTICALGDAAAWPVQSMIRRFRDEFEKKVKVDVGERHDVILEQLSGRNSAHEQWQRFGDGGGR